MSFCHQIAVLLLTLSFAFSGCKARNDQPWAIAPFDNVIAGAIPTEAESPKLGLKGFSKSGYAEQETGIYLMEEFDPQRIPILFIHGLLSDPKTWKPMVENLKADPEITSHFQFWFYAYPSGTPVVPSAAILKRHLDAAVDEIETNHGISMERRLIVVGHSMGGILSKSLISDSGDDLWDTVFVSPAESFDLTPPQRNLLTEAFRYQPRSYVDQVIFIATPHRGSDLATGIVGKIGSRLSTRPQKIESLAGALIAKNSQHLKPEFFDFVKHKVNSISTLRPDSPVTNVLANLPVDEGAAFHTIAGVKNTSNFEAGDGVVPLSSTHIEGTLCEAKVNSNHSNIHKTPLAAKLVGAIFKHATGLLSDQELDEQMNQLDLITNHVESQESN